MIRHIHNPFRTLFLLCFVSMASIANLSETALSQTTFDFENLPIPAAGFYNGDPSATGPERSPFSVESTTNDPFGPAFGGQLFEQLWTNEFNDEEIVFSNSYETAFNSWSGFAWSNVSNVNVAGQGNQYAAFPGSGAAGSANYLVASGDGAVFSSKTKINSFDYAITTYTALAALNQDDGGNNFLTQNLSQDGGFFELVITGADSNEDVTGQMVVPLADYRNGQSIIADQWSTVDVTSLNANSLTFSYQGSDMSFGFLNTPTYFAADNIVLDTTVVPEPGSAFIAGLVFTALVTRRRRSS